MHRAAPPRRTDDAVDDLAQIDPVAMQFQGTGVNSRDGQQVTHHFIKTLGLGLDLAKQILLCCWRKFTAVVNQAARRPKDRR